LGDVGANTQLAQADQDVAIHGVLRLRIQFLMRPRGLSLLALCLHERLPENLLGFVLVVGTAPKAHGIHGGSTT